MQFKLFALYRISRLIFPLHWLASFGISASTWVVTRNVTEQISMTILTYQYKGWPYPWAVTNAAGTGFVIRQTDFMVNLFIWFVITAIALEIILRLKNFTQKQP
ncbi:MAG TPA: hypothetical protein PKG71_02905 [Candidatus Woesebacteria bacterium]|nr:hypothetical protein [Candidatus Woesebacteria bacterium]HNS94891.1 hypothetical protein [Candidatus Woesebacteria bacterium]